ncbi:rhizobiocin [Allorhizobium undicola]|uniref:rhizobiocin n=1 Tax=Allorhizobium undicola TaxID=78527 RepID=UPI003D34958D
MALTVTFGNGGAATVADLQNVADQAAYDLLDSTTTQTKSTIGTTGSQISSTSVAVESTTGQAAGTVDIQYDLSSNSFDFDVATKWNSVKNALAVSDTSENLTFKDFVQVDVSLGGTGNSTVEIYNVKRTNVTTGDGNDTVTISMSSNDKAWVNAFSINTGKGNDTITLLKGEALNSSDVGGVQSASVVNGGAGVTDGSFTSVTINAGAGNDTIDLSAVNLKSSTVTGGAGTDTLIASGGTDTFVFNSGDFGKTVGSADHIEGFALGTDKIKLTGTAYSDWKVTNVDGDSLITYVGSDSAHAKDKIVVDGVDLTGSSAWFTA